MAPENDKNTHGGAIEHSKQENNEYPIIPELLVLSKVNWDFYPAVTVQKCGDEITSVEAPTWQNMPFELYIERAAQYITPEHLSTFQWYWPCMQYRVALLFNIRCIKSKKLVPLRELLLYRLRKTKEETREASYLNYRQSVFRKEERRRTEIRLAIKSNKQRLPSLQSPKSFNVKGETFAVKKQCSYAGCNCNTGVNAIGALSSSMASYEKNSRNINYFGISITPDTALNREMRAQMPPEASILPVVQPLSLRSVNTTTEPLDARAIAVKEQKLSKRSFYNSYGFKVSKPPAYTSEDPECYLSMPAVTYCESLEDVICDMLERKEKFSTYDTLNDSDSDGRRELIESQPIDTVLYHVFLPNAVFIDENGIAKECNSLYQLKDELNKFIKQVSMVYDMRLSKITKPQTKCMNLTCYSQKKNDLRRNPSFSESDNPRRARSSFVCSCRGLISIKYSEKILALRVRHKHHQYNYTKSL